MELAKSVIQNPTQWEKDLLSFFSKPRRSKAECAPTKKIRTCVEARANDTGIETHYSDDSASTDSDEGFSRVIIPHTTQKAKRYCLVKTLGSSAVCQAIMAVERHGHDFDRLVFIKKMHDFAHKSQREYVKQAFLKEAHTLALLNHPQIPQILDVQNRNNKVSIIMEYVDGQSLDFIVSKLNESGESLPIPIACSLVEQICGAVHFAHNATDISGTPLRIIHRNINLKTLMVDSNGYARLIGFDIAKNSIQGDEPFLPIPPQERKWAAPELVQGAPYDHRVDIYSIGLVLSSLLGVKKTLETPGHKVFCGKDLNRRSDIPTELKKIIATATHPDPQKRYRSADAFCEAIANFALKHGGLANAGEIKVFFRRRFHEEIVENRRLQQELLIKGRAKLEAKERSSRRLKKPRPAVTVFQGRPQLKIPPVYIAALINALVFSLRRALFALKLRLRGYVSALLSAALQGFLGLDNQHGCTRNGVHSNK